MTYDQIKVQMLLRYSNGPPAKCGVCHFLFHPSSYGTYCGFDGRKLVNIQAFQCTAMDFLKRLLEGL